MESGYFSEWLKSYRTYLRMRNYSPRTLNSYEQVIKHFAYYVWLRRHTDVTKLVIYWKDFETARLDTDVEVTPVIITDFLSFVSSMRTYKPKTFHRIISTLSSFYRFLYTQGAVTSNPLTGIDRPRIKQQDVKYLKHNQVLRLLDSIEDPRDKLIVRTIYATGVRVSELCNMNIEDIDFDEHTIRIRGKGDKIRTVFIDDETLADILKFIGNRIVGPVFIGQQGKNISSRSIQHIFKHYAPSGITPHKIR
ncbi:tyrosine-type recombinase/integrase, partial [Candidatus Bathyarchaeota archaeon]|nr:tyrosine-type recombinase/integrase [Candidatus Bathyarchaeota archaeon]